MKTFLFLLLICFSVTSCSSLTSEKFNVAMGDMIVGKDTLTYSNATADLKTEKSIRKITEDMCLIAKYECNFPSTFKPTFIMLYDSGDTVHASLSFSAQNAYGVPDDVTALGYYHKGKLVEGSFMTY